MPVDLTRRDNFVIFWACAVIFIAGGVLMAYKTPYWEPTLIFFVPGTIIMAIVIYLLKFVYTDEKREARKIEKELKRQQRIIRQKEEKIRRELEERKAYAKGRSSRTAKAAKLLDSMEASKRRM